jgi:hypothetical protein
MENENEEGERFNKKELGYKLILLIGMVLFWLIYKFLTGQVNIDEINKISSLYQNNESKFESVIKTFQHNKEYIITLSIMAVVLFFLMKNNREWERDNILKKEVSETKEVKKRNEEEIEDIPPTKPKSMKKPSQDAHNLKRHLSLETVVEQSECESVLNNET